MEVDRLQPILDIETRTGLFDPGEVSVTEDLGFGIVGAEALEKFYHGLLLGRSASVGGIAVGIETALVANANAVGVVMLGMGAGFALGAAWVDHAVFRDVVVVADGSEATSLVAGFQGFYREIPGYPCGGTVDYYHVYFSHNEFFFIILLLLFYNLFSKITPSFRHPCPPLAKRGSLIPNQAFPFSKKGKDVAGDAIALPEFWSASGACALKGWLGVPTQQSCDCLCGVNRLAESLLVQCLRFACGAALGYSPSPLGSTRLDAEGGGDGGEDGDEEVDDGFPIFFFHFE